MSRLFKSSLLAALLALVSPLATVSALEEIKIGSTGPGISILPIEMASRKGFFRDEGFDVLNITMRANIAVNALLTRGIDYATPSTSIVKAATSGLPVKLVGVLMNRPDYFLIARKEIRSVKELKGKRIAIGSFGAAADLALGVALRTEALDPDRDVVRLQMGGAGARYGALAAGTVDATILTLPFNLDAEKAGFKNLLWLGEKLEMPLSGLAIRDETIQRNPRQIFSMLRAILRAIVYAKSHSEESSQILVNWIHVEREVAIKSLEIGKHSWPDDGTTTDAAIKLLVEQTLAELKNKSSVSLDMVRDWSFAKRAKRDLEQNR
jgi:ABC-type nitrate/sulfonate/bicarbonate transport system substrate-binding protein